MRVARGLRTSKAVAPQARPQAIPFTFDAPVGGWVTNTQLSRPVKRSARLMRNWFVTTTGIVPRGGSQTYADLGSAPVKSLFPYVAAGNRKMHAALAGSIWDISGAPAQDVTGQGEDEYATAQLDTGSGGVNGQYWVNGVDKAQLFNGSTWQAVTAISAPFSITGCDTALFAFCWVYRDRLYFIERNSMSVWYLPLLSLGGAVLEFTLSGTFEKGGSLKFGGSWSLDTGAGPDDKWFVVSTEGEVAVFQGSDPGATPTDPDPWRIIGRYDIGRPLGMNATMRAGGDVVILTADGAVPLSQVPAKDPAALSLAAVSAQIEPDWKREAAARTTMPWSLVKWTERNRAIVGLPKVNDQTEALCFVINLQSGAWSEYDGWDVRSLCIHDGKAFFGTSDGRVMEAESGGNDDGAVYVCKAITQFSDFGRGILKKILKRCRATFRGARPVNPQISFSVGFAEVLPSPPNSASDVSEDVWDTALWDQAVWDAQGLRTTTSLWRSAVGRGEDIAANLQVTCGVELAPDAELVKIDVTFELGAVAT